MRKNKEHYAGITIFDMLPFDSIYLALLIKL